MSRRIAIFALFAAMMATVFIRLGFWQLGRMHERQGLNAYIGSRIDSATVPYFSLSGDSARTHFRRVTVQGTPDFAHEFYLVDRTRSGSPGVYVLTPVRVAGQDTAVLVNRGWVYSPDASTIKPPLWHAADTTFEGYVAEFEAPLRAPPEPRHLRSMYYRAIASALPYPLADTYVVALGSGKVVDGVPFRITPPPLDEGPFRSYAIQWFSFALISLGGAAFVILKEREARRASAQGESTPAGA